MRYKTLKQRKLKQAIKSGEAKTVKEAHRIAGYSDSVCRSGSISKHTKPYIADAIEEMGYSKKDCYERFNECYQKAFDNDDATNALRSNENITRMGGFYKDVSEQTVKLTNEEKQKLMKLTERLAGLSGAALTGLGGSGGDRN